MRLPSPLYTQQARGNIFFKGQLLTQSADKGQVNRLSTGLFAKFTFYALLEMIWRK